MQGTDPPSGRGSQVGSVTGRVSPRAPGHRAAPQHQVPPGIHTNYHCLELAVIHSVDSKNKEEEKNKTLVELQNKLGHIWRERRQWGWKACVP